MPEEVDMLTQVFERQREFKVRVAGPYHVSTSGDVELCVQRWATCIMMEAAELLDWTRWKQWSKQLGNKRNVKPGSEEHIGEMRMEIADVLCFLVNCAIDLSMSAEDLNRLHEAKMLVNYARQGTGSY